MRTSTSAIRILAAVVLATIAGPPARAGEDETPAPDCGGPTGWKRFACDSRALGQRFSLRDPRDRRFAFAVVGTTALLYAGRDEIRDFMQDHKSQSRTDLYEVGRVISKGAVSPLLAGVFALAGQVSGNSRYGETAQILLESTLYSVSFAAVGQFVLSSERPEDGDDVDFFQPGGHGVSGDVALAASVVAPLDRRHLRWREGDGGAVRALKVAGRGVLYSALALTALQRMEADKHWAPDVFLGAAGGLSIGYALCTAHEPPRASALPPPENPHRPSLVAGPDRVLLVWSF